MLQLKIADLPQQIPMHRAVESCYRQQIRFIFTRLAEGMSVLIRCEKQLIPYLQQILRKKLTAEGKNIAIVDGRATSQDTMQNTRINNIVNHLREIVHDTDPNRVFLLPYIDIITSVSHGGLSLEGKEIMTIIHENPFLVLAAFEDPDFPVPELIAQAFPAKTELLGIARDTLGSLITATEARKFAAEEINVMQLYKYVSGLNAVRLRQILQIFAKKTDYNPNDPAMLTSYYRELREYTATGGASLSTINLDHDIAGYAKVKQKIHDDILGLLDKSVRSDSEETIAEIESIIPKGIIFYGPPGTGKTLFAKGIAEAINATIYIVSGPELKSKWVGEGEANIRRLFARARATAPSIIVFDELDSIAAARSASVHDGASSAGHSMVNQLLTEMDGFRKEELVFIIGTTNFPESLDPAFLRPGRFEYQIEIGYPDWQDRREILALYNQKLQTGLPQSDIEMLARWTGRITDTGTLHTGDHLNALIRDLKRHLIRGNQSQLAGAELLAWLRSRATSHKLAATEEKVVAVHECGHALVYHKCQRIDDIERVTIDSGVSHALGMVEVKLSKNNLYTQQQLLQEIAIGLGGYAAEKIVFQQYSTGAVNDLQRATAIAEDMVTRYGMGNLNVPRSYYDEDGRLNPYYYNVVSPQVDAILLEVLQQVQEYLQQNRALLDRLTAALMEQRTLEMEQVRELLQ